jgi:phospholipase C
VVTEPAGEVSDQARTAAEQRALGRIEHVVVLMLENRSFDHFFGYLDKPGLPKLDGTAYPNPLDVTVENGPVAYPKPGANHVLEMDPPHSHNGATLQTNGSGWTALKMNGFAHAYRLKVAGREHLPVIEWDHIEDAALIASPVIALAAENFVRRLARGRWWTFAPWAAAPAVALLKLLERHPVEAATGIPEKKLKAAAVAAGVVAGSSLEGIARRVRRGWGGAVPWLAAGVVAARVGTRLAHRRATKKWPPPTPESDAHARDIADRFLLCMEPDAKIPVLAALARQFALCTAWFSSVPGATWPNRNFLHAGTSEHSVDIEIGLYNATTVFEVLDGAGLPEPAWRIYRDGMAQVMAFENLWEEKYKSRWRTTDQLAHDIDTIGLAPYTFIEPRHDGVGANSMHPGNNMRYTGTSSDIQRGEELVREIYNVLKARPEVFAKTVFLITFDEHGGLFDRQRPPPCKAPKPLDGGDLRTEPIRKLVSMFVYNDNPAFAFTTLGVRVPTIVVSPWIAPQLDDTTYDHTSVIATLLDVFAPDGDRLTERVDDAKAFHHLVGRADQPRSLPDLPPPAPNDEGWFIPEGFEAEAEPVSAAPIAKATVGDAMSQQLGALASRVTTKLEAAGVKQPAALEETVLNTKDRADAMFERYLNTPPAGT